MNPEHPESKNKYPEVSSDPETRRNLDLLNEDIAPIAEEKEGFWQRIIERAEQDAEARKVAEKMIEDFFRERTNGFSIELINDSNYFIDGEIREKMGGEPEEAGLGSGGDHGMTFGFIGQIRLKDIRQAGDQWKLNVELLSFEEKIFGEYKGVKWVVNSKTKERNDFLQFALIRDFENGPIRAEFGSGLQVVGDMGFMSPIQSGWHVLVDKPQREATYSSYNALSPLLYLSAEYKLLHHQDTNLKYTVFTQGVGAAQMSSSKKPWSYITAGLRLDYEFADDWEISAEFSNTHSTIPSDISMASDIESSSNNFSLQLSKIFGEKHKGWIAPRSNFRGTGGSSSLGYEYQKP